MNTWLPHVPNESHATGTAIPCVMQTHAWLMARAWMALLGERAKRMRCDERLVRVAQAHAEYLAGRIGEQLLESMHVGAGGTLSNERVRAGGYRLPSWYPQRGNHVESCARHNDDPATVIAALAAHHGHREHLLGLGGYENHTVYGVGHWEHDWVVLACPEEG